MSFKIWMHWALVTLGVINENEYLDDAFKINDIIAAKQTPISTFLSVREDFLSYCHDVGAEPIWDVNWPFQ